MYIGSQKNRIRIQRGISIVVLIVSTIFLGTSIYRYTECGGPGYYVVKAITGLCLGGVMFRLAGK
jgi:hypothetical protein